MDIFIASDHAGFHLKEFLKKSFELSGQIKSFSNEFSKEFLKKHFELIDLGTDSDTSCDYPIFAKKLAEKINEENRGMLICGTGIGMSIAANRFSHIRAALCVNETMAQLARQHNDANVLVLGARIISEDTALKCIEKFLSTDFEGGRHQRRLSLINF